MVNRKKTDVVREHPLTYKDYSNIDDGHRYELVGGMLELLSPSPSPDHQFLSAELGHAFGKHCRDHYVIYYAPIDMILSDTEVRQPDIVLIKRSRFSEIVRRHGIIGPPDLVVEILSPSSVKRDKESKLQSYARFLIPEYWVVDPSNQFIEQYVLDGKQYSLPNVYVGDDQIHSSHITCVSFSMNEIVANILKAPED